MIVLSIYRISFLNLIIKILFFIFIFLLANFLLEVNSVCSLDFEMVQNMFRTKSLFKGSKSTTDVFYALKNTELGLKTGLENGHISNTVSWIARPLVVPKEEVTNEMVNNFENLIINFRNCRVYLDEFNFSKRIKHFHDLTFALNDDGRISVDIRKYTSTSPKHIKCTTISTIKFSDKLISFNLDLLEKKSIFKQYIEIKDLNLGIEFEINVTDDVNIQRKYVCKLLEYKKEIFLVDYEFIVLFTKNVENYNNLNKFEQEMIYPTFRSFWYDENSPPNMVTFFFISLVYYITYI